MLQSQVILSPRYIYHADTLRTKEPRQIMTEDLLISGRSLCGQFTGMAEAARRENAHMIGGGSWRHVDNGNSPRPRGKASGHRKAIMAHLSRQSDWQTRAQIIDATGIDETPCVNALYSLTTNGQLIKRVLQNGGGTNNRQAQWRVSNKSMHLEWEKPRQPRTNRQIVQLVTTNDWQTTRQISKAANLTIEQTYKALQSLAAQEVIEKSSDGKKRTTFNQVAKWRKAGAKRIARESADRQTVLDLLSSGEWITTPQVADLAGWKKGKAASQLARLYTLKQVESRMTLINGRHTKEWRRKEGLE